MTHAKVGTRATESVDLDDACSRIARVEQMLEFHTGHPFRWETYGDSAVQFTREQRANSIGRSTSDSRPADIVSRSQVEQQPCSSTSDQMIRRVIRVIDTADDARDVRRQSSEIACQIDSRILSPHRPRRSGVSADRAGRIPG